MNEVTAFLSDGKFLQSLPVELIFTAEGRLIVKGESLDLNIEFANIRVSDRLGSVPRFIYLENGMVIESIDQDVIDRALFSSKRGKFAALIYTLEGHSIFAAIATFVIAIAVGLTLHYGVPYAARRVAYATPATVETRVGSAAVAAISKNLRPTRLAWFDRNRVEVQLRRLLPDRRAEALPTLVFRSTGGGFANAFALPGGFIVITDELLPLTSDDDEIAAVLAHELGHLEKHHGLQSALNSSFALLFVTSITGDLSTLTTFAGTIPFTILQNGYSREYEREADQYARDLMIKRGIPLRNFITILTKLEKSRPKAGADFSYLSTHPSNDERLLLFKESSQPAVAKNPPHPALFSPHSTTSIPPLNDRGN